MGLKILSNPVNKQEILESLLELSTEHDIHLIPCGANKRPLVSWKKYIDRKPDSKIIHNWFIQYPNAYWGALTGKNFGVIDLDTYKNDQLEIWAEEHLPFTPLRVKTRNGGCHLYYQFQNLDVSVKASTKGLDIRNKNGFVIIVGEGYQFQWLDNKSFHLFSDLPSLSHKHLSLIEKQFYNGQDKTENNVISMPVNESWHTHVLKTIARWVAEGRTDNQILKDCTIFTQTGYSHQQTIEEVRKMIAGAREKDFGSSEDEEPIKALTIANAFKMEQEKPTEFIGEGFIAAGFRLFVIGPPKVGKSQFILEALTSCAYGGKWLDMQWDRPHKVLWLQAEIRGSYVGTRLKPMYDNLEEEKQQLLDNNFFWTDRGDIDLNNFNIKRLKRLLQKIKPSLVAIDPFANYFDGDSESDNSQVTKFFKKLNNLFSYKELGFVPPALVLVHHTRKLGASSADFEAIRGASAFQGWYDSGLLMIDEEDHVRVKFQLRNGAWPNDKLIKLDPNSMQFVPYDQNYQVVNEVIKELAFLNSTIGIFDLNNLIVQHGENINADSCKEISLQILAHPHIEKIGDRRSTKLKIKPKFKKRWEDR